MLNPFVYGTFKLFHHFADTKPVTKMFETESSFLFIGVIVLKSNAIFDELKIEIFLVSVNTLT